MTDKGHPMTDPRDGAAMTERERLVVQAAVSLARWNNPDPQTVLFKFYNITTDYPDVDPYVLLVRKVAELLGWRPPPGGDVVARTATVLRYRMEDIGLVQEIEGEDGGEIYDGERTYVEAGHILARHLADDGLLATPPDEGDES